MFEVNVNLDGLNHKLDTLALSAADLEKPLAVFGGYMRRKALAKYETQAFAPLAESTLEKRAQKGLHSLERKLAGDVRKARRRSEKGTPGGLIGTIVAEQSRGVRNRLAVLAELQRRNERMWAGRKDGIIAARADLKPLSVKQLASLDARTKRAVDRAVGKPILGNLTRSLVVEVSAGSMTLTSRTAEAWSDVHNKGGTAGHGAKMPERRTIEVESSDLEVLVSILKSHLLLPLQEGMHGPGF